MPYISIGIFPYIQPQSNIWCTSHGCWNYFDIESEPFDMGTPPNFISLTRKGHVQQYYSRNDTTENTSSQPINLYKPETLPNDIELNLIRKMVQNVIKVKYSTVSESCSALYTVSPIPVTIRHANLTHYPKGPSFTAFNRPYSIQKPPYRRIGKQRISLNYNTVSGLRKINTHHVFIVISGIGKQVKNTVISKKNFRPHTSDRAPISGALRNDRIPLMPITRPFIRNVWSGNVWFRTCNGNMNIWLGFEFKVTMCTYGDDGHRQQPPCEKLQEYYD